MEGMLDEGAGVFNETGVEEYFWMACRESLTFFFVELVSYM